MPRARVAMHELRLVLAEIGPALAEKMTSIDEMPEPIGRERSLMPGCHLRERQRETSIAAARWRKLGDVRARQLPAEKAESCLSRSPA